MLIKEMSVPRARTVFTILYHRYHLHELLRIAGSTSYIFYSLIRANRTDGITVNEKRVFVCVLRMSYDRTFLYRKYIFIAAVDGSHHIWIRLILLKK